MKNLFTYLIIFSLFSSCGKSAVVPQSEEPEAPIDGGVITYINLGIVIADENLNDRLDPKSPSYFGEEFAKGIEVLYFCDGNKLSFLDYYYAALEKAWSYIDNIENFSNLNKWDGGYYLDCTPIHLLRESSIGNVFLRYPGGTEDNIKVQIWKSSNVMTIEKVWINDELVYEMGFSKLDYFNPNYYPWMKPMPNEDNTGPLLDKDGNILGYIPVNGRGLVVLKK